MNYGTRLTVDDRVRSLFQLDPVLPALYQNTFQRRFPLLPEKTLMLAVLDDAVACFQKYALARNRKLKQLFLDAENWILEKDGEWFFSFEQICSALGWDPTYVRHGLMRGKKELPARPSNGKHDAAGQGTKKKRKARKVRLAA